MKLSKRINSLAGSDDSWAVYLRAAQMKAAGAPVVMLSIGEHDIPTDPAILDQMHRAARAGHTGYSQIPGTDALRDAVARRVESQSGVPTTRDNVLVTPGGQAGLFAAHMAVLDSGDTGLLIDPYYATYPTTIRATGAEARTVIARPDHGFEPRAEDILAAADGASSLLVNSPNNPTGVVYSPETWDGIAGPAPRPTCG